MTKALRPRLRLDIQDFGTGRPSTYQPLKTWISEIETLPTESIEDGLKPCIRSVQLFQTTNGNTVLQISGKNFFTGTTVTIGDKTFAGPQDGLLLKSSQTILLTANTTILSQALSAVVNGRYGPAVPLYPSASSSGIVIAKSKLAPDGPNYSTLEIIAGEADPAKDLTVDQVKEYPGLILTLNGAQIPYRPDVGNTTDTIAPYPRRTYIVATVKVPNSILHARDNRAGIIFPLLGEKWSAEYLIYDADEVQVSRMATGKTTTLLISRPGMEFNDHWRLILDKAYSLTTPAKVEPVADKNAKSKTKSSTPPVQFSPVLPCQDPNVKGDKNRCYMLEIVADPKFINDYQKFILVADNGFAQVIDIPPAAPQKEAAPSTPLKVTTVEPNTVRLNEVVTVTITGSGLEAVKQVTFEGKPLAFWATPDKEKSTDTTSSPAPSSVDTAIKKTQIQVLLSREVTQKEGHQELLLQVDAKNMSTALVTVSPGSVATKSPSAKNEKRAP